MELKAYKGSKCLWYIGDKNETHFLLCKVANREDGLHFAKRAYKVPANQWSTRYDKMRGYEFAHKTLHKGTRDECIKAIEKEVA